VSFVVLRSTQVVVITVYTGGPCSPIAPVHAAYRTATEAGNHEVNVRRQ
jgi:hypothetical protein